MKSLVDAERRFCCGTFFADLSYPDYFPAQMLRILCGYRFSRLTPPSPEHKMSSHCFSLLCSAAHAVFPQSIFLMQRSSFLNFSLLPRPPWEAPQASPSSFLWFTVFPFSSRCVRTALCKVQTLQTSSQARCRSESCDVSLHWWSTGHFLHSLCPSRWVFLSSHSCAPFTLFGVGKSVFIFYFFGSPCLIVCSCFHTQLPEVAN